MADQKLMLKIELDADGQALLELLRAGTRWQKERADQCEQERDAARAWAAAQHGEFKALRNKIQARAGELEHQATCRDLEHCREAHPLDRQISREVATVLRALLAEWPTFHTVLDYARAVVDRELDQAEKLDEVGIRGGPGIGIPFTVDTSKPPR